MTRLDPDRRPPRGRLPRGRRRAGRLRRPRHPRARDLGRPRRLGLRYVGMRTELSAGFAADGYARAGGRPGVLLTTTGPGSFVATCALMEARTSYVPLVNIVSQVPRDVIGTNRGFLHELPTQSQVLAVVREVARGRPRHRRGARPDRRGLPAGDLRALGPGRARDPGRRARGRDRPARAVGRSTSRPIAAARGRPGAARRGRGAARVGRAARALGRRRRAARGRLGGLRRARRAARRARRDDLHGQGRDPGRPPARASAPPATRARSRSSCAPPTSCSPSAPSSAPRPPASGRCASRAA